MLALWSVAGLILTVADVILFVLISTASRGDGEARFEAQGLEGMVAVLVTILLIPA